MIRKRRRKRGGEGGHGANAATDGRLLTTTVARCEEEGEGVREERARIEDGHAAPHAAAC